MLRLDKIIVLTLMVLFFCMSASSAQDYLSSRCITFDDKPPSSSYKVHNVEEFSGIEVNFEKFAWLNQQYTHDGYANIDAVARWGSAVVGSGQNIWTNNISLRIALPKKTQGITMTYGSWGGNINLAINGDLRNSFISDDTSLGLESIVTTRPFDGIRMRNTVNKKSRSYIIGELEFRSVSASEGISSFLIGGQELLLDDICILENRVNRPDLIENALSEVEELAGIDKNAQELIRQLRTILQPDGQ